MSLEYLRQKRLRYVEIAKENGFEEGLKRFLTDLYPAKAHFIYELLQNAEDTCAKTVRFVLAQNHLEFEHDGVRLFDIKDVEAITSYGNSTKRDDHTSIGKFGVGFKAVFAYTDAPEIHSGDLHFRIHDLVVPEVIGVQPPKSGSRLTKFVFPFTQQTKQPKQAAAEVECALRALSDNTLLFLSHIRTIEYLLPDGSLGSLQRVDHDSGHIEIRARHPSSDLDSTSHWLRFESEAQVTDEDGVIKSCRVAIAYQMVEEIGPKKTSSWKIVPLKQGQVSIYFPAEKETSKLRFHIHAPFASTVARDSVRDCDANQQLRDHVANLIVESMFHIRDAGILTVNFLAALPNIEDALDEFYEPIRAALVKAFCEEPLTPTKSKSHAPAKSLFRGPSRISGVLDDVDFSLLAKREQPLWVANPSQQYQRDDKFLESLNIEEWSWYELTDTFSCCGEEDRQSIADWISQKNDAWVMRFYALLGEACDQHDKTLCDLEIPLIRIEFQEHQEHVLPSEAFLLPEDDQTAPEGIRFVKPTVYKQGKSESQKKFALSFLKHVGVRSYDARAVIELALEGYTDAVIPAHSSHFNDLSKFFSFWKKNPNDAKLFKAHNFLLGSSSNSDLFWCKPSELCLDEPYLETGLANLSNFHRRAALWGGYREKLKKVSNEEFIKFVESIGIISRLPIEHARCHDNPEWDYLRSAPGNRSTSPIDTDYTIRGLSRILKNPTLVISRLIWTTMFSLPHRTNYLKAVFRKNQSGGSHHADSQLVHTLRLKSWIPQGNGVFVRPTEATRELLPEGFAFDAGWTWIKAIHFGIEADKQTKEYQKKEAVARDLGFKSLEEIDEWKKVKATISINEIRELVAKRNRVPQPEESVPNPERRRQGVLGRRDNAPNKESITREKAILPGAKQETLEAKAYLRAKYKNTEGQLICQCCQVEMPFTVGEHHYFEAVQCVRGLDHHYFENRLALCPTCAAKYQHARGTDNNEIRRLIVENDTSATALAAEIPVKLAGRQMSLRFVGTHIFDLKTILGK